MKYKVGDKVRVRGDLEVGKRYGNITFISNMGKNKVFKILVAGESENYYDLDDEYNLSYSSEMLRPAKFKIWCNTEEEKQAVLVELEKEGYRWCSGDKPTNGKNTHTAPVMLYVENGVIRQNRTKKPSDFTPSEFTGIDFSEKIIIIKTPTGATATYGDKKVTTEGDFEDASRQALAEVLCPFKVGDEVKLKRNGVVGEIIDISGETRVKLYTREDIYDEWCLLSELKPYTEPLYNAKLFCIKGSGMFDKGYIYEVKNGKFTYEHFIQYSQYKDLDDVNNRLVSQFMEVKG